MARRHLPLALAAVVAVLGVGALGILGVRRVRVEGDSMVPTVAPGDRLLVLRVPRTVALGPGRLVAAADPRTPRRMVVKRVVGVAGDGGLVLAGDNPARSTDSRTFGPVPRASVHGVVWYRYAPPARAGLMTGAPRRTRRRRIPVG